MEEEADEPLGVGVEPEGVGALDPLGDVAGKITTKNAAAIQPTIAR
ncbi:MAG: hypothetical protein R2697_21835 [Ilumatobacteraceae bacterium]